MRDPVDELRLTQPPPELETLIATDPLVRACWQHFRCGLIGYEKCLLLMVTELARQKQSYFTRLMELERTRPIIVGPLPVTGLPKAPPQASRPE